LERLVRVGAVVTKRQWPKGSGRVADRFWLSGLQPSNPDTFEPSDQNPLEGSAPMAGREQTTETVSTGFNIKDSETDPKNI
jgi:hypothetical protein